MPFRTPDDFPSLDRRRALRRYRAQNSIWLWLGVAAALSLITWLLDPQGEAGRTAIGRTLSGPMDDIWHVLLGAGGVLVFVGIWSFRVRAEIIGHMLVAVAVALNAAAVIAVTGLVATSLILIGVAAASASRMWYLWVRAAEATP